MHWDAFSCCFKLSDNLFGKLPCKLIQFTKFFTYFLVLAFSTAVEKFNIIQKNVTPCNVSTPVGTTQIFSVEATQGFITSVNYPNQYLPNKKCLFELSAPIIKGLVIHLTFIDLDIEDRFSKSRQCLREYIRFMITDREGREHVGQRYCGSWNGKMPPPVRSMQSKIHIEFVSSYETSKHRGFKIRFDFVAESTIGPPISMYNDSDVRFQKACGGINDFDALSGEIQSPGYPFTHPTDVVCNWLIRVEPHKRVYLRLLNLELSPTVAECDRASLLIFDGYHHEVSNIITRKFNDPGAEAKFCGRDSYYSDKGMKSYLSVSNRVIVRFVSRERPTAEQLSNFQNNDTSIGFRLLWTEVVNSVVLENESEVESEKTGTTESIIESKKCSAGFLCNGGKFCIDGGLNVCSKRVRLCINKTLRCNGIWNCAENDDSDEIYCFFQNTVAISSTSAFVFFLCLTLIVLTIRTFFCCKTQRHRLKDFREQYSKKFIAQQKQTKSQKQLEVEVQFSEKYKNDSNSIIKKVLNEIDNNSNFSALNQERVCNLWNPYLLAKQNSRFSSSKIVKQESLYKKRPSKISITTYTSNLPKDRKQTLENDKSASKKLNNQKHIANVKTDSQKEQEDKVQRCRPSFPPSYNYLKLLNKTRENNKIMNYAKRENDNNVLPECNCNNLLLLNKNKLSLSAKIFDDNLDVKEFMPSVNLLKNNICLKPNKRAEIASLSHFEKQMIRKNNTEMSYAQPTAFLTNKLSLRQEKEKLNSNNESNILKYLLANSKDDKFLSNKPIWKLASQEFSPQSNECAASLNMQQLNTKPYLQACSCKRSNKDNLLVHFVDTTLLEQENNGSSNADINNDSFTSFAQPVTIV